MARHIWSVLCERALVDQETHSLSLIDVMEEFTLEGALPEGPVSVPLRLALVSYWMRTDSPQGEQGYSRFHVLPPRGESLATGREIEVDLRDEPRVQTVGKIEVMPLHGAGTYHFVVEYRGAQDSNWSECARIPLEISLSPLTGPA